MKIINRIFYLCVEGIPPYDVSGYINEARKTLLLDENGYEKNPIIKGLKKMNLWEDFFIPTKGDTKVEILEIEVTGQRLPKEEKED